MGRQEKKLLTVVLNKYYEYIDKIPEFSRIFFCEVCEKLFGTCYPSQLANTSPKNYRYSNILTMNNNIPLKRFQLHTPLMQALLNGLKYCVFQANTRDAALPAIRRLYDRASHDLIPEIMLATLAILNLLQENYDLQVEDKPTIPIIEIEPIKK